MPCPQLELLARLPYGKSNARVQRIYLMLIIPNLGWAGERDYDLICSMCTHSWVLVGVFPLNEYYFDGVRLEAKRLLDWLSITLLFLTRGEDYSGLLFSPSIVRQFRLLEFLLNKLHHRSDG